MTFSVSFIRVTKVEIGLFSHIKETLMKRFAPRITGRVLVTLTLGALVASACSSSSKSTSGSGTSGSVTAGVRQADQVVVKWTKNPTSIGVTTPVGKPIPSGKTIDFMSCGTTTCQELGQITKEAGEVLGWTVKVINAGTTAESVHAAWLQVARELPDGVVGIAYPRSFFEGPLQTLKSHGVPVVECCTTDPAGNGIDYVTSTPAQAVPFGALYADWIIHDTRGKASVVFVDDKDFPIIASLIQGFIQEYKKLCPSCPWTTTNVATADVGTTLPGKVVGFLRAHPDINYVALGWDGMAVGLPQALQTAGLSGRVKFIGEDTDILNKTYIMRGQQAASVSFPLYEGMYRLIDVLAREFVGQSIQPDETDLPAMIFTKSNIRDPAHPEPLVLDYKKQFQTLWGLS